MSPSSAIASPLTLASLYSDHHGWLKKWLTHKLQSAYDADDVAQDTFVRIMAGGSLSTIRDPKSFLCTIAKRVMIDLFRRNALERAWLEMLSQLPEELSPSPDGLNVKAREAFLLSQLEGLTYADIASRLAVSVSSVKKYIAKATEHCLLFRLENGL